MAEVNTILKYARIFMQIGIQVRPSNKFVVIGTYAYYITRQNQLGGVKNKSSCRKFYGGPCLWWISCCWVFELSL